MTRPAPITVFVAEVLALPLANVIAGAFAAFSIVTTTPPPFAISAPCAVSARVGSSGRAQAPARAALGSAEMTARTRIDRSIP